MPRSFTISGMDHVIRMLNQYPQLNNLSSLAPIFEVGRQAKMAVTKSGCGCSAAPIYNANKAIFEQSLAHMAAGSDQLIVKNLLHVDQICYYTQDKSGKRVLNCV